METIIIVALLGIATETTYLTARSIWSNKQLGLAPIFVDTSVLIDGRIIAIAQSGFLTRPLYIPRSVIGELQLLADTGDSDKRARARHGLDVIQELQNIPTIQVKVFADGVRANEGVDNRLLTLAKRHKAALCTIDYNLNKVAAVEGLEVLNVNDLAKTLRMAYLPGEKIMLELTQKGHDAHQAIGHLSDGTMVVVEQAGKYVGKTLEIEFIRSLQTAAGKMMFAKPAHGTANAGKAASESAPSSQNINRAEMRQKKQQPRKQKQVQIQPSLPQTEPLQQPQRRPQAPKSTRQNNRPAQQQTQRHRNDRPRRTMEDSLIDLANR